MKKLAYLLILVPLVAGGWMINDRATFHREAWIADYEQLRQATEQSYANLRWSRESKNIDLVALNAATLEQLQQATSNSAARRAIASFVSGFNDGHFRIESSPPKPVAAVMRLFEEDAAPKIDFSMDAAQVCSALGFSRKSRELTVDGAQRLPKRTFAAGTIRTASNRTFGIIRIPLFRQYEYGAICERSWTNFVKPQANVCAEGCQEEFHNIVKHDVAQALADDARALAQAGAEAVVIDLTGNGGGTEWAELAAAVLSARPLTVPAVAFIRGPHWEKSFAGGAANLEAHLKQNPDDPRRALIEQSRANSLAMVDSARTSCDLSQIWTQPNLQPACWNVVNAPREVIPRDDMKFDRPYDGRVLILTDAATASASEQFAATLKDNGVAETIGTKTMGVGCGYTNGGNPVTLKHSKLVIWMPDCARLRADGSNEFEGVKPDHTADWGKDQASKTAALLNVLDKLPKR